jgi:hypothetical protein
VEARKGTERQWGSKLSLSKRRRQKVKYKMEDLPMPNAPSRPEKNINSSWGGLGVGPWVDVDA